MTGNENASASMTGNEVPTLNHNHPLYLQASDAPGVVLVPIKLTGPENYALWSRSMKLALRGKGKLGFIDGSCAKAAYKGVQKNSGKSVMQLCCHGLRALLRVNCYQE
ncbi:hypothetical protein KY284_019197 [Solanum tuberosum]|nr:hypothetical protein KY284_019197 [Solanum tuberosum]